MSKVENINPEKEPIPASWVPRVITGGKGPPSPPEPPVVNWLQQLPVNTIFAAVAKNAIFGFQYELIFKGDKIYLLHQWSETGMVFSIYINPEEWCKIHTSYEVLGRNLPPEGEEHEHH